LRIWAAAYQLLHNTYAGCSHRRRAWLSNLTANSIFADPPSARAVSRLVPSTSPLSSTRARLASPHRLPHTTRPHPTSRFGHAYESLPPRVSDHQRATLLHERLHDGFPPPSEPRKFPIEHTLQGIVQNLGAEESYTHTSSMCCETTGQSSMVPMQGLLQC
jgi:hypothetical protein